LSNEVLNEESPANIEIYYTSPFVSGTKNYLNIGILQNNADITKNNVFSAAEVVLL